MSVIIENKFAQKKRRTTLFETRIMVDMIKLIASDLDGTLLQNGSQALTPRAVPLILRLAKKGIRFAAASGRQYPNLVRLFGAAADNMAFICENGAFVLYRGNVIAKTCMEPVSTRLLIQDILAQDDCEVLISGEATSYVLPKTEQFLSHLQNRVKNNVRVVRSLDEIPEEIIKVSAYNRDAIQPYAPHFFRQWQNRVKCTVSDLHWIDFVHPDVNKGAALSSLLSGLGIRPDEAVAFGDNYNDLEMLSLVRYGCVMENASPEIRERYRYHTACVEDTLENFLARLAQNPDAGIE